MLNYRPSTHLIANSALFVIYFLAALIPWNISVNYAWLVPPFLAGGIALGFLIRFGIWMVPGLWAGAFCSFLLYDYIAGVEQWAQLVSASALFASGVCLQLMIVRSILSRVLRDSYLLDSNDSIFQFVLISGPCSAILPASMVTSILYAQGLLGEHEIGQFWALWWVGDGLGSVLGAPLVMIFLCPPYRLWRKRRVPLGIPLFLFTVFTMAVLSRAAHWEDQFHQQSFLAKSKVVANNAQSVIESNFQWVKNLERLYRATQEVEYYEFVQFVVKDFEQYSGVQALGWAPRILGENLEHRESELRQTLGRHFVVTEKSGENQLVQTQARDIHFPLAYVMPLAGNENLIGFDLNSEPVRRQALEQAIATNAPAASAGLELIQAKDKTKGFIVAVPVFDVAQVPATVAMRYEVLRGFVVGTFSIERLIGPLIRDAESIGLNVQIHDITEPTQTTLLYATASEAAEGINSLLFQKQISVGGRIWHMQISPSMHYIGLRNTWQFWMNALVLFLGAIAFTGLLLFVTGRTALIEALVERKTDDLNDMNQEFRSSNRLLGVISSAQMAFISEEEPSNIFAELLEDIIDLTESDFGFISEVLFDQTGQPYLKTNSFISMGFGETINGLAGRLEGDVCVLNNRNTLLGQVMESKGSVISNEGEVELGIESLGIHLPKIHTFIGLPVFSKEELIGVVGIANRIEGYEASMNRYLEPFLATCANLVLAMRAEVNRLRSLEDLRESEEYVRSIVDHAVDGIISVNAEGVVCSANLAAEAIFCSTESELQGRGIADLIPELASEKTDLLLQYANEDEQGIALSGYSMSARTNSGTLLPAEVAVSHVMHQGEKRYIVMIRDISGSREYEQKLNNTIRELEIRANEITLMSGLSESLHSCEALEEAYQVVASIMPKLVPHMSGALYFLSSNAELLESVCVWGSHVPEQPQFSHSSCIAIRRGLPYRSLNEESPLKCRHLDDPEPYISYCLPLNAQGETLGVLYFQSPERCNEKIDLVTANQYWGTEDIVLPASKQIAMALANIRLRESLRQQSIRDPLTSLYNRRFMSEMLNNAVAKARREKFPSLSVLTLDIDHFKQINDSYGHDTGDSVLRKLSATLTKAVRDSDVVCRFGGEEFVIILNDASDEITARRTEEIREAVADLRVLAPNGQTVRLTASIGYALYGVHGNDGESLLRASDEALYRAKRQGRNRVVSAIDPKAVSDSA